MATIGGLSGGTSNSVSMYGTSIKGYGGLASGLDTDSLIEGMTIGTRTKIQEALKKKQNYQWEMDGYRSISSQLISFSSKYLSVTGTSSPFRASFFDKSVVTALGANSKYMDVSGVSSALESMRIKGVKQIARDTTLVTNKNASIESLNTGSIAFGEDVVEQKLDGQSLTLTYDDKNYTLNFNSNKEVILNKLDADGNVVMLDGKPVKEKVKLQYDTPEHIRDSVNRLLANVDLPASADGTVKTLGSKVRLGLSRDSDGKSHFNLKNTSGADNPPLSIGGGTENGLKFFGFIQDDGTLVNSGLISKDSPLTGVVDIGQSNKTGYATSTTGFADYLAGKEITFSFNGTKRSIKFPDADEIKNWEIDNVTGRNDMEKYIQEKLDGAFGADRILVSTKGISGSGERGSFSLAFTTEDPSSVLRITDADKGIMGEGSVLGISYSMSNRLNTESSLKDSVLKGLEGFDFSVFNEYTLDADGNKVYAGIAADNAYFNKDGTLKININGKDIKGLTVDSSLGQVMRAINDSDAGVKISYVETADRFSIAATNHGESGEIKFNGAGGSATDFMSLMVGGSGSGTNPDYTLTQGQDSIMTVVYEGNVEMDIKRDTKSFNLDGATFNLKETFGYAKVPKLDVDGNPVLGSDGNPEYEIGADGKPVYKYAAGTEDVTFTTAVDADKMAKVIASMVEDYNKVLEETFNRVGTKPTKGYGPLTDDEKSKLTTDEIKKLEDKAKEGVLFNDPLLRSLSEQLRSAFTGVADVGTLKKMGINIAAEYGDNGKISFDEEAFKSAVLTNTDQVKDLFTKPADDTTKGGFTVRLKAITEGFAKKDGLVKGSLIQKAGSTSSPTSVLKNALKDQMDELDDQVERLKDKLQTEIDRYTKQFSSLEQLISQMNSQSSWLQSSMGG